MPATFLLGVLGGVVLAGGLTTATYLAARSTTVSAAAASVSVRPVRWGFGISFLGAAFLLWDLQGPHAVQRATGVHGATLGVAGLAVGLVAPLGYGVLGCVAAGAGYRRLDVPLDGSVAHVAAWVGYIDREFPMVPFAFFAAMFVSIPSSMVLLPAMLPADDAWVAVATGVGFYALVMGFVTGDNRVLPRAPQNRVADALE